MSDPIVSVTLDGREVLRLEGDRAHMLAATFDDQARVAEALGRAISVFLAKQPPMAPLARAAHAVALLAEISDPTVAGPGLAEIAHAITDLSDRLTPGAGTARTH